jgi:uncharacterized HAD superfamily protein
MVRLVGIDIDGVLSDIAGHLVQFANDQFGHDLSIGDITSEDVETCSDVSKEQLTQIFCTPRFFQTLPVLSSASESLVRLKASNWRIVLVTDRFWYPGIKNDTLEWLRKHNFSFDSLHFIRKVEKANFARDSSIPIFIEDQLSNANGLARVCDKVFLIDRSYNQGPAEDAVIRVSDVGEAVSLVTTMIP